MSSTAPSGSAAAERVTAPDRYALHRLLRVWLGVALIETLLFVFLHRSPELKGLYKLPAVAVLVAGVILSWHARRGRAAGHDRRHGDRRHGDD